MSEIIQFDPHRRHLRQIQTTSGMSREAVVRFVSKPEGERARLIREARAIYDRIFPPADPPGTLHDKTQDGYPPTSAANACRDEGTLS
jgi:hypothetical protein